MSFYRFRLEVTGLPSKQKKLHEKMQKLVKSILPQLRKPSDLLYIFEGTLALEQDESIEDIKSNVKAKILAEFPSVNVSFISCLSEYSPVLDYL